MDEWLTQEDSRHCSSAHPQRSLDHLGSREDLMGSHEDDSDFNVP